MFPYWLLFLFPALLALASRQRYAFASDATLAVRIDGPKLTMILVLTLMIGLRFDVGGDWPNYAVYVLIAEDMTLGDALARRDPAYWVLNVIAARTGLGIAFVNTVCATIFAIGLVAFSATSSRPWLAIACAVPYLVVVVAMGYTRQSVAIGFSMIGLTTLRKGSFAKYVLWVLAGALFHSTAIILIPIVALLRSRRRIVTIALVGVIGVVAYAVLLAEAVDQLVTNYIDAEYSSSGALIRLVMNVVPAGLFLTLRRRFIVSDIERQLYSLLSYVSVVMFLGFFVIPSSTALDRLALYLIPLQMFIFSRLPQAMARTTASQRALTGLILAYHAAILFVWLTFANNAFAWLPYRTFLL